MANRVEYVWATNPGRQEALRHLWPELWAALSGAADPTGPQEAKPAPMCPICSTGPRAPKGGRRPATGRLWRNGAPGCADCIERSADRPGGWPLERQEEEPRWNS